MNKVFLWILFLESALTLCAADSGEKWSRSRSRSSFVGFVTTNEARIVSLKNVPSVHSGEVLGLDVTDNGLADWSTLGKVLTNLVCLRVTTTGSNLPAAFFVAITNYPSLQFVHLHCRQVYEIPSEVSLLTNLVRLRYLGIDAPSATNIDRHLYHMWAAAEKCSWSGGLKM
jgi:hypothetical protein